MKGKKKGTFFMLGGALLLLAAFLLTAYNLYDERRAEKRTSETLQQLQTQIQPAEYYTGAFGEVEYPDHILVPEKEMPSLPVDGQSYIGLLSVPALNIELPVLKECSDRLLKLAPCCYDGSVYLDNMVIAAHNYKSHFGRLESLRTGDEVTFTDIDGNAFYYKVSVKETLEAYDLDGMVSGDWDLTLFTCNLSRDKRVTIRCEKL